MYYTQGPSCKETYLDVDLRSVFGMVILFVSIIFSFQYFNVERKYFYIILNSFFPFNYRYDKLL